jgi:hypothetical protein
MEETAQSAWKKYPSSFQLLYVPVDDEELVETVEGGAEAVREEGKERSESKDMWRSAKLKIR